MIYKNISLKKFNTAGLNIKADRLITFSREWDNLVVTTFARGLGGFENLSYIPGTCGAAAVQNIGAYGCEVEDTITRVRAIRIINGRIRKFLSNECGFGYRDSIFKNELKGENCRCLAHRKVRMERQENWRCRNI